MNPYDDRKRAVVFVAAGISSLTVSGGDVRWIEIAKEWKKHGIDVNVLTTDPGVELCKRLGLCANFYPSARVYGRGILSDLLRFLAIIMKARQVRDFHGAIYSTSEGLDNALPSLILKRTSSSNIWVAVVHWLAPLLGRRVSFLPGLLLFLETRIGLLLAKRYSEVILCVSKPTASKLLRLGIQEGRTVDVCGGVDTDSISRIGGQMTKIYDGLFLKRLHQAKGAFDLPDIWKYVASKRPASKLLIVGEGAQGVASAMKRRFDELGILPNVEFHGPIFETEEKARLLAQSRLLLLPSYEENWGLVIGEALAAGIPVVCYDLPDIRPIWKDNVIWVPLGDRGKFAQTVLDTLEDPEMYVQHAKEGIAFTRALSWDKVAREEFHALSRAKSK